MMVWKEGQGTNQWEPWKLFETCGP